MELKTNMLVLKREGIKQIKMYKYSNSVIIINLFNLNNIQAIIYRH